MTTHLSARAMLLTALAMTAFAANSLLCRGALAQSGMDPAAFTLVRLASGAICLAGLALIGRKPVWAAGSWAGAAALLIYAATFSFAYVGLTAGTGALLLFGAVQLTMVGAGLWRGERLTRRQWAGLAAAIAGVVALVAPGVTAPPLPSAGLMVIGGIAWGAYSLLGRRVRDPMAATAGNFIRAAILAGIGLSWLVPASALHGAGLVYALASGAVASGLGYALWYATVPLLAATQAASVQLSVPVITALGAALLMGEGLTGRLILSSAAILGGIALVIRRR